MGGRRVSIKDVARAAGVSVTTVSHALNDKGRLNPHTRERVREVADHLGYRPNPAARSLVSGRTQLIAVMASLPEDPPVEFSEFAYYSALIGAATTAAVARDHSLVVSPPGTRNGFVWDRVPLDGVIVIDPIVGEPALPALREREIPFVTIGRDPDGGDNDAVVSYDVEASTSAVLDHLAEAGAKDIGLLSIPLVNAFAQETLRGYERWCERTAREPAAEVMTLDQLVLDPDDAAETAVGNLLARRDIDAIYAPLEIVGVTVARALRRRGLAIPDDVLLVTTEDAGHAAVADPPITTLSFDHADTGRRAAEMLLDLLDGRRTLPQWETAATALVPRRSTARHAAG
jgi:DNA-binding LacI/PurR family transcriptional regulator